MERRFIITNISGERGKVRTTIPIGGPSSLPPGRVRPRHKRGKRGRYSMVVPENKLRNLIGFIRRGQLRIEAQDGGPLPDWILAAQRREVVPEPTEESVPEPAPAEEAPEGATYDLTILDASVGDVSESVASITDVGYLQHLLDAEEGGKTRKTAIKAIQSRMEELNEG